MKNVFISGTGTNVGKTFVCAFLLELARANGRKAHYWKPIQCGPAELDGKTYPHGDVQVISEVLAPHASTQNSIFLQEACSPHLALELEDKSFDKDLILSQWNEIQSGDQDVTIVEGAGGLLVPIESDYLMENLIQDLGLPLVLISKPTLGTLNHSLLSIRSLPKSIELRGMVFSYESENKEWLESDNKKTIKELCTRPLHEIPSIPAWEEWKNWSDIDFQNYLSNSEMLQDLLL